MHYPTAEKSENYVDARKNQFFIDLNEDYSSQGCRKCKQLSMECVKHYLDNSSNHLDINWNKLSKFERESSILLSLGCRSILL
jgi:hypothetical protein